jgi:hypothetical protein
LRSPSRQLHREHAAPFWYDAADWPEAIRTVGDLQTHSCLGAWLYDESILARHWYKTAATIDIQSVGNVRPLGAQENLR